MNKLLITLFFCIIFTTTTAHGQVREIPVNNLPDFAITSMTPSGETVIYYNPQMVASVGRDFAMFMFNHEYGHVNLKHLQREWFVSNPYNRNWVRQNFELEADCFAAKKLFNENPQSITVAIKFWQNQPIPKNSNYPPGNVRAQNIAFCANTAQAELKQRQKKYCNYVCKETQNKCLANVVHMSQCMTERVNKCVDTCVNKYNHKITVCKTQLCVPTNPVNAEVWDEVCSEEIQEQEEACEEDYEYCEEECD